MIRFYCGVVYTVILYRFCDAGRGGLMGSVLDRVGAGDYVYRTAPKDMSDYLDKVGMYICCAGPRNIDWSVIFASGTRSSSTDKNDSPAPLK